MSEQFSPPVELFGEHPDDFALRSAAAEGVLEQMHTEEYVDPITEYGGRSERRAELREKIGEISARVQDSIEEQP